MRASLHARLLRRRRARANGFPARTEVGMTLVELMVAISILAIVMSGLALSIGVDYKAVALARARQVAESIANQRLEELRDVDYSSMALMVPPVLVQSSDPTNPDSFLDSAGTGYNVTGTGSQYETLITSATGPVDHFDTQTVGTTVVDIYQYVTWVDDPGIAGTQNLKRLTVVVRYHTVPTIGQSRLLRESVVLTPGNVTLGSSTANSLPAAFSYAQASSPPYTINFTDTSTGSPTGWQWDFNNDGTVDSTAQNPTYTFAGAGSYLVTLTVIKGSDSGVVTNTVSVTDSTTATTTTSTCGSFTIAGSSGASVGYTASTTVTITMALGGCGGNIYANFSNDGGATWGADFAYSSTATTLAWTLTGANGSKTISGQARSTLGGIPWSLPAQSIILDTTPPTMPSTLNRTLSCAGSTRSVTLAWLAATDTNLVGYHIYTSSDGTTYALLGSASGLTFTTTNNKNANEVDYKVKAYDAAGNESTATSVVQLAKQQCS